MEDRTGHRLPSVTFNIRENYRWVARTTEYFFRNKRVVIFALPGAFTPVCSSLHLPSYNDLYDTLRANGVDDVYCLAVNDGFVLEAWKRAEKAEKITMLPDVDGEFSRRLGFLVDRRGDRLGERSWRYAMVVDDQVIEKMFIEAPAAGPDPYGASSAEAVLRYLNPAIALPDSVTIFAKHGCLECEGAKAILRRHRVPFEEFVLNEDFSIKTVKALSGSTALPQIFVNGVRFERPADLERRYEEPAPERRLA
jgi:peroxiredoxin/glutaredoxin